MNLKRHLITILTFILPVAVHAQEWKQKAKEFYDDIPFKIAFESESISGTLDGDTFSTSSYRTKILAPIPKYPLQLFFGFGLGKSYLTYFDTFDLNNGDKLEVLAVLHSEKPELQFGSGIIYRALDKPRLTLDLQGSVAALNDKKNLSVDTANFKVGEINLDMTEYVQEHGGFDYDWGRYDTKATLRYNRKYLSLYAIGGITKFNAEISINIDQEGEDLITAVGGKPEDIEAPVILDYLIPNIELGGEIHIKNFFSISLSAGVLPIKGDEGRTLFKVLHGSITLHP